MSRGRYCQKWRDVEREGRSTSRLPAVKNSESDRPSLETREIARNVCSRAKNPVKNPPIRVLSLVGSGSNNI